jgi:uncharacterized protein
MKVIYLHGFASGPKSAKAVAVKRRLDKIPDFEHLRPGLAIDHVASLVDGPCVVAGSSLGGLMALHVAGRSEHVKALVVMCPALIAFERWKKMLGDRELERWRREGARRFYNFVTLDERPVDFGFFEDLAKMPDPPAPRVPVTLIHGRRDEVVPVALSEDFARAHPERVKLTLVDDDHSLLKHVELVNESVLAAVRQVAERTDPPGPSPRTA